MQLIEIIGKVFGSKTDRDVKKLAPLVVAVNGQRESVAALSDEALAAKTIEFRQRIAQGTTLDDLLPEAFAVVREATHRVLGEKRVLTDAVGKNIFYMAHFDVQIMGGITLHQGKISEMKTGEGKTQVALLAAYLNALSGKGVHVITVNDYLARRDSSWMGRVFSYLGLTVGCLDLTEPGSTERRQAYNADITYGTNNEFGFDYLRDNMAGSPNHCVQRELNYAIIDEVDNILVDEARTPLIISGPVTKNNREYEELRPRVAKVVAAQIQLVQKVIDEAEKLLADKDKEYEAGFKLLTVQRGSPKNKKLVKLIKEAGVSRIMKTVETDYLRERKLHEIDEELYYVMDESGHSAELTEKGRDLISGSTPDFFVVPNLAEEVAHIDNDETLDPAAKAERKEDRHRAYAEGNERIHCVSQLLRAFSLFERDVDYVVQDGQILIVDEFTGRILVGRRYSDGLHQALEAKENVKVAGENQTLATITFQNYFKIYKKISGMTGTATTEAAEFHEIYKLDVVTIPTNRGLKRKDFEDEIYKTHREKYNAIVKEIQEIHALGRPILVGTTSIEKSELISKLLSRAGIKHDVLNAKQHAREAVIVAQAGRLGSVTIATNMAGRGTDIVLGGNFDIMVNDQITREGMSIDDLSISEKRKNYAALHTELQDEHQKVIDLGGLHIIGTERHEARRIDNQLRGRAGRQGDPGSSKFFLSLDDDLMRIFGSGRIASIMERLGAEDGEVISHPLVTGAIGNAQKRVEGRNFDQRKHLKEYDDVMNLQRTQIYGLRQRILKGEDVRDEILDQTAAWLEDAIFKFTAEGKYVEEWNLDGLYADIAATCGVSYTIPAETTAKMSQNMLFDDCWKAIKSRYEAKEVRLTSEGMRQFERGVFLMVIDNLWKDHLYEMDHLKDAVQYRSFAQKNPLFEYQREGLKMFEQLRSLIARDVSGYIFRLEAVAQEQDRMGLNQAKTVHAEFDAFSADGQPPTDQLVQAPVRRSQPMITNRESDSPVAAPIRVEQQVGRNDACPCGSGKKYKKCHGATA